MGRGLGCRNVPDSAAHSRHSEYGSRHSFQTDRDQNRMDLGQGYLPIHLSEVLQTRSGSLCISLKSSSTPVCVEVPRSRSAGRGNLSSGLEQVDLLIHPCGRILKKIRTDQAMALLIAPNWAGKPMVPGPSSDAGGSTSTPAPGLHLAVWPLSGIEATGFSKEAVAILVNSHPEAVCSPLEGPDSLVFSTECLSHFSSCCRCPRISCYTKELGIQNYCPLQGRYFSGS